MPAVTGLLAVCLLFGGSAMTSAAHVGKRASAAKRTPIQIENARHGYRGWSKGLFDYLGSSTAPIQGYASEMSASPGQTLDLHVSVQGTARYRIQIFRLGWYGGVGARLVGCVPGCGGAKHGKAQPMPSPDSKTGEIVAHWPVTDRVRTRSSWVSGYYIAKLILLSGAHHGQANYVAFVLRASSRSSSTILVEASVNTWQAYNGWGGKSLYDFNSGGKAAVKVSFDRPNSTNNSIFMWEYPFARFLERNGYDVAYTTDVDTDRDPAQLLHHRLVIDSGHGEYWSKRIRDAFDAAKASGVNLAFLGADIGDWQIRYEDNQRTIVEYRDASRDPETDPALKTTRFRDLATPRPQCQLLGIQYQGGFRSDFPQPTDYHVNSAAASDPWFAGTHFTASSTLPGLVGYEWDGLKAGCPAQQPIVLFHASGPPNADAVKYVAASGAKIFSSGSLQFVWGLDNWGQSRRYANPHLVGFMKNALADLTKR